MMKVHALCSTLLVVEDVIRLMIVSNANLPQQHLHWHWKICRSWTNFKRASMLKE